MTTQNVVKWVVFGFLVAVGVVALFFARQMIAPLDGLLTSRACSIHGDELSRPVVEHERSNRFGLVDRSHGWCLYGPIELEDEEEDGDGAIVGDDVEAAEPATDGVDTVRLTIDEIEPGGLYAMGKLMGIVVQLGAASVAVRTVAEPLLDRFVRSAG